MTGCNARPVLGCGAATRGTADREKVSARQWPAEQHSHMRSCVLQLVVHTTAVSEARRSSIMLPLGLDERHTACSSLVAASVHICTQMPAFMPADFISQAAQISSQRLASTSQGAPPAPPWSWRQRRPFAASAFCFLRLLSADKCRHLSLPDLISKIVSEARTAHRRTPEQDAPPALLWSQRRCRPSAAAAPQPEP